MSNHLAIATVTATIYELLSNVKNDVSDADITNHPLDVVVTGTPQDSLNIFLYHVTPNVGYRNLDQPARSNDGTLVRRPQLGLNLHYMITAITAGNDDVKAHLILASAMRILHETPTLTRDMIRNTINNWHSPSGNYDLKDSDLADQIELVKITSEGLSIEEITKLWSSFFQTNYRISATYEATVVLLDSIYESKPTLPVTTPQITTMTFRRPIIQQVQPQILDLTPPGKLTLTGQNFRADKVVVQVGDTSTTPSASDISDTQIVVSLPSGLTCGVKTVQVVQSLGLNSPTGLVLHKGFESNVVPFMLAPKIEPPPPPAAIYEVNRGKDLTLSCQPAVAPEQRVSFLIGDYEILVPQREPASTPVTNLSVVIPETINTVEFPAGTFLIRIRVDGAESLLQIDNDKANTTYGQFILPIVKVT